MFGVETNGSALDNIAHIIQVALTPVFLLSGIATLLNVFSRHCQLSCRDMLCMSVAGSSG